jgi:hypothetical protein
LTFQEIPRELRQAGKTRGAGPVTKALAELAQSGRLVNLRDKKGYRQAGGRRTPRQCYKIQYFV